VSTLAESSLRSQSSQSRSPCIASLIQLASESIGLTFSRGSIGAWIKNVEPVQDEEVVANGHLSIDGIDELRLS